MSLRMLENLRKAQTGPYCKETEFDLRILFPKLKELIKEYKIKFDPEVLIPEDDSLAKDVFRAGLELFLHTGVYCKDTSRIIKFDESEVKEALRNAPTELILGQGNDAYLLCKRNIDDNSQLMIRGGAPGSPVSEGEIYVKTLMSYIKEPSLCAFDTASLQTVEGEVVRAGSPTEIIASKREGIWAREAAKRCGRPGVHLVGIASSATSLGTIAAYDPEDGFRKSDGSLIPILPELKTSFDTLCKVASAIEYGIFIVQLTDPLVGGVGGFAEGIAILSVATNLAGLLLNQAHYFYQGHLDIRYADNADQYGIWISSIVGQSMAINTKLLMIDDYFCRAGPCTKELLYQVAAKSIVSPCSGYSGVIGVGSTGNSLLDHCTGLEAKFMSEVVNAATGLKRSDANEFVKILFKKYEESLAKPQTGKSFQECYDLKTLRPSSEWQNIYDFVKKELDEIGLPLEGKD